jgi:hypothetical protein
MIIEPGCPFKVRQFDGLARPPGRAAMYHFRLVQAVDGLEQRIDAPMATRIRSRLQIGQNGQVQFLAT